MIVRDLMQRLLNMDMESTVVFDFFEPSALPRGKEKVLESTYKYPVDIVTVVYDGTIDRSRDVVLLRTREEKK